MTVGTKGKSAIIARRAEVSRALLARKPYRQIAEELGVSMGTIQNDIEALKKEWAEQYNQAGSHFENALQTLDQAQALALEAASTGDETVKVQVANQVHRIQDQRNKLLGLYPTPGKNDDPPPTGPITLKIDIIGAGNSSLIVTPEQTAVEPPAELEE